LLKSGETSPEVYEELWTSISSGNVWEGELLNRGKHGKLFWEHTTISPLRDTTGKVTNYLAIKEDITEKKSMFDQLVQAQKVESIGQLAGGIAHDFNNILSVISGYAYIMKLEIVKDSDQLPHLEQILSATAKAGELTQGLLAYSRKQVMNPVNQNLNSLITTVGSFITRLIGEHITFTVTTLGTPLMVHIDTLQIEQVLMNLATNARDAMQNGGTFSITTTAGSIDEKFIATKDYDVEFGRYAIITVTDTGCGMSADITKRIFDPFYTTKEVGKGTVFTIYLPLVDAAGNKRAVNSSLQTELGQGTILVAEDESGVRDLIDKLLSKYGYTVILAVDGQEAVDKYAVHKDDIDLVILDMVMPRKSGKAAYDEIRLMNSSIDCLFVSGYARDFVEKQGELGENSVLLPKPIQPNVLLDKIAEILKK